MNDTDLEPRVAALEAAVLLLNGEMNDVEDMNLLQEETLNALEDRLNTQDNRILLLEGDISDNENDIAGENRHFLCNYQNPPVRGIRVT